jgi:hypothetical protein
MWGLNDDQTIHCWKNDQSQCKWDDCKVVAPDDLTETCVKSSNPRILWKQHDGESGGIGLSILSLLNMADEFLTPSNENLDALCAIATFHVRQCEDASMTASDISKHALVQTLRLITQQLIRRPRKYKTDCLREILTRAVEMETNMETKVWSCISKAATNCFAALAPIIYKSPTEKCRLLVAMLGKQNHADAVFFASGVTEDAVASIVKSLQNRVALQELSTSDDGLDILKLVVHISKNSFLSNAADTYVDDDSSNSGASSVISMVSPLLNCFMSDFSKEFERIAYDPCMLIDQVFDSMNKGTKGSAKNLKIAYLNQFLKDQNIVVSVEECQKMFDEADTNGDKTISKEEFRGVVLNSKSIKWMEVASNLFSSRSISSEKFSTSLNKIMNAFSIIAISFIESINMLIKHVKDDNHPADIFSTPVGAAITPFLTMMTVCVTQLYHKFKGNAELVNFDREMRKITGNVREALLKFGQRWPLLKDTAHASVKFQATRMTESEHDYASNMDNMYSIHFPELEEDQEKQKSHLLEIKFDEQVKRFCCCCCCCCCSQLVVCTTCTVNGADFSKLPLIYATHCKRC